jgi:hypothetical protein
MTRGWLIGSVGILTMAMAGGQIPTPAPEAPASVVHVGVTRQDGRTPVAGLGAQAFELWVDGSLVPIQTFSATPAPLTAVVVLDGTWTMSVIMVPFIIKEDVDFQDDLLTGPIKGTRPPNRPPDLFMEPVRQGLLRNLRAGDRLRFASISRQIRLSPTFASERSALDAEARKVLNVPENDRFGPSPIWDGVDDAVKALASEPGRRAIILVTDGLSTGNRHGLTEVARRAALASTAVYVVQEPQGFLGTAGRQTDLTDNPWILVFPLSGVPPRVTLTKLSDTTGGTYVSNPPTTPATPSPPMSERSLTKRFEEILRQIHQTYTIGFEAAQGDGAVHKLEVRMKDPNLRAQAPALYRSPRTD